MKSNSILLVALLLALPVLSTSCKTTQVLSESSSHMDGDCGDHHKAEANSMGETESKHDCTSCSHGDKDKKTSLN